MNKRVYYIAYKTIVRKEILRFARIWVQTLLPPAVTMALYFLIFGRLIGPRIGSMGQFTYTEYIAPGLIMMSVITNSYANVVSSFFGAKFQKHIEELLVAPIPNCLILAGFITGGVARGLAVGTVVTGVALFFTRLSLHHTLVMLGMAFLTAALFSLAGLINGIFAKKFDDISIIPTFVLTPLTYLGGVFYSMDMLPQFWQKVSLANPILYMVSAFRYGMLGTTDVPIGTAFAVIIFLIGVLLILSLYLMNRGIGIRT
jgi:ABC-2 type transport system permease protein